MVKKDILLCSRLARMAIRNVDPDEIRPIEPSTMNAGVN